MRFPRPQFSLFSLLIFMGLVGVGAKLWVGPHRAFDQDLNSKINRNCGLLPEGTVEVNFVRDWNGKQLQSVFFRPHINYFETLLSG